MQTKQRSKKKMMLCIDEWNVWDLRNMHPEDFRPWQGAPAQVEQTCRMVDAVVFGGLLIALLQHAARVREHLVLADDDFQAVNTAEAPDRLVPRAVAGTQPGCEQGQQQGSQENQTRLLGHRKQTRRSGAHSMF